MVVKESKDIKKNRCFYLPMEVIKEGRAVSAQTGISFSRLVADGLRKQIEKYRALELLKE